MNDLIFLLFAYLLGSIPFGLLLTRFSGNGDIRSIGSGNIGATNVLRTGNKNLALLTLLFDSLKGTLAVLLADETLAPLAGLCAVLGHVFPVWLQFKGGKGVATILGVVFILSWPIGGVAGIVWLIVAFLSRYSSLSSLTMAASLPLLALGLGRPDLVVVFSSFMGLVFFTHRENIQRLRQGKESKIGRSRKN